MLLGKKVIEKEKERNYHYQKLSYVEEIEFHIKVYVTKFLWWIKIFVRIIIVNNEFLISVSSLIEKFQLLCAKILQLKKWYGFFSRNILVWIISLENLWNLSNVDIYMYIVHRGKLYISAQIIPLDFCTIYFYNTVQ